MCVSGIKKAESKSCHISHEVILNFRSVNENRNVMYAFFNINKQIHFRLESISMQTAYLRFGLFFYVVFVRHIMDVEMDTNVSH